MKHTLKTKGKSLKLTTLRFTLIELLAVIMILAIVATIATPIVVNIIDDSEKSANLRSAEFYVDAVELSLSKFKIAGQKVSDGVYLVKDGNICRGTYGQDECLDEILKIDATDGPKEGILEIENGLVTHYDLIINDETITNATDLECFTYIDNYDYTIDEDKCNATFSRLASGSLTIEKIEGICGGDKTLSDLINATNYAGFSKAQLESLGIIENASPVGTVSITGYKCGGDSGKEKDVIIPSRIDNKIVTTIAVAAFLPYNALNRSEEMKEKNIDSVVIPNSVTTIEYSAFVKNKLTNIKIPDSVKTIGEYAFLYNNLTSVSLGSGVTTIGDIAFEGNNLTNIKIPNSVETIGRYAFYANHLTTVTIGSGITSIGNSAFGGGTYTNPNTGITYGPNAIENVYINRNQSNVTVGSSAFGWANGYYGNLHWNSPGPTG